jgi:hypothetical protein
VADFAAAYFDACVASTDLPRLVVWEGLELEQPIGLDLRQQRAGRKVEELAAALPGAATEAAAELLLTIVTLCHGWLTGPNLARIIAGDETAHQRRRDHVVAVARLLVRGKPAST